MKRPFLLDTCACLWIVGNAISDATAKLLAEAYNDGLPLFVSPITAWEIGNMARKGRLKTDLTPKRWFAKMMGTSGMQLAEMPPELLIESALLPGGIHNDPADRIIAATAREYGYTVLTRDRALLSYAKQGHLSAIEC
ncbi:MAG TPA: type II toxin-antitoxin system VapC family toxin [Rhizomicrobium sp.]|jgi:PIN domain nuclease of toxin-antitoxin system|nr:type II toxin-antitoxin system VapC family toxin [Rhizomicrobium sp.]